MAVRFRLTVEVGYTDEDGDPVTDASRVQAIKRQLQSAGERLEAEGLLTGDLAIEAEDPSVTVTVQKA